MRSLGCLLLVLLMGCAGPQATDTRLGVGVGIAPLGWLLRAIGGDVLRVQVLVPPSGSPETFQPSDADITALLRGKVYFSSALPIERGPWMRTLRDEGGLTVVDLAAGLPSRTLEAHGHAEQHVPENTEDPHRWVAPRLLAAMGLKAAETLAILDPTHAQRYRERAQAVHAELVHLAEQLEQRLAHLRGRSLLCYHPSWGYLADSLGLRQLPVEQYGREPSDAELSALQRIIQEEQLRTIIVQPQNAGRAPRVLSERLNLEILLCDPLPDDVPAALRLWMQQWERAL